MCSVVVCVAAALCVWVSLCMLVFDFGELPCAVVSVRWCVAVSLCLCVAVSQCRCLAVLLCVALRCIGRSLRLSAAVVAQQRLRYAGVGGAAVVLSHDASDCSCSVVASSPSDVVPALWCVLTPVMHAAVFLLYVSLLNIVVLLFCMCVTRGIRSLSAVAVLSLLLLLLLLLLLVCAERLSARA